MKKNNQIIRWISFISLTVAVITLSGCASIGPNVAVQPSVWHEKNVSTKIAFAKIPSPALYRQGSQGILDVVVSDIATDDFSKHLSKIDQQQLTSLGPEFVAQLRKHGIKASMAHGQIDTQFLKAFKNGNNQQYAQEDYRPLAIQVGADRLLLLTIQQVGALRGYYGFIPLGAPRAVCSAVGRLVNLRNNKILWRYQTQQNVAVQGVWDQPPAYPNFDMALAKAISQAKRDLLNNFFFQKS